MQLPQSAVGSSRWRACLLVALVSVMGADLVGPGAARADVLRKETSWQAPDSLQIVERVRDALMTHGLSPDQIEPCLERLQNALQDSDGDVLDSLVGATAPTLPVIERLLELSEQDPLAAAQWVNSADPLAAAFDQLPLTLLASTRTWLGRELVQARLYDEALPMLADMEATDSLDPASVLFYRGVCRHSLLQKKEALADLRRLLENEAQAPVRFVRTAQLMIADLKPLEEDSLDEISRLMTDVTRRLDLGRANSEVEEREQTIIDKLSKLIDDMEEQQRQQQQQQQQQQAAGSQGQGGSQGQPMQDSQIAGGSGQGDVDSKNIGQRDGWGNLPPAQREEALQQISRDLPTHYREAIEAYFRKLATGG